MDERYFSNWATKQRQKLSDKIKKKRIELQLSCKHTDVVEAKYRPESWYTIAEPPIRVCKLCGFAEEGWSCGFQILKNSGAIVSRFDAINFAEGGVHRNAKFVRVDDCTDKKMLYRKAIGADDV